MTHDDDQLGDTDPELDRDGGLDDRSRRARREVEELLDPVAPHVSDLAQRATQRRRLATSAAGVVVALGIVAAAVIVRGADDEGPTGRTAGRRQVTRARIETELIRSSAARTAGDPTSIPTGVEATSAFAVDLHRELAATEKGNFFVSPYSISVALTMTMAGAAGRTRNQLAAALHVDVPEPAFHDAMNALDQALTAPRPTGAGRDGADALELTVANSLWGQAGYPFRKRFLDQLARSYDAGMNVVDFVQAAEASRVEINEWVAAQTDDKIPELIPQGIIDDMTRLVLVNAILFKASWVQEFTDAVPGAFTTADGKTVQAQMMHGGNASTAQGAGWQSVSIPYVGGAHMVVIVPDDLERFEDRLTPELLDAAASGQGQANVVLPKFSTTSALKLKPLFGALGVVDAFDPTRADLSRIGGTKDLYVSEVVHQATIDVDEQGTEAAAATAVIVVTVSAPPTIEIDRPFVFAIRDDATGAILFTGRVTDPTAR